MNEFKVTILSKKEVDEYVCTCGNTSFDDGFYPCNTSGMLVEPVNNWCGLYVCTRCNNFTMVEFGLEDVFEL